MKRLFTAFVAALGTLVLIAAALVWLLGNRIMSRGYQFTARPVSAPLNATLIAEGERLARTRGCLGCHGPQLGGKVFFEEPGVARIVASNLTRARNDYNDAQLERVIRHGIRSNGRSVVIMPSDMYYHLSDPDLAAIMAYVRSVPDVPDSLPPYRIGPLGYLGLVTGKFQTIPSQMDHAAPRLPGGEPGASQLERGRYLATTTCTECHGMRFQGGDSVPALAIVGGYSFEQFRVLMRTGIPLDGRALGLMKDVALNRTSYFTDLELLAIYEFLRTLASGRIA